MSTAAVERLKYRGRLLAGHALHALGTYDRLLPVFLPSAQGLARRLQAYLMRYYESVQTADACLYLDGLGLKVACDIRDHMLWNHLEGKVGIYEQLDIDHCRAQVRAGDRILDVGANHGFWGFALGKRAGGGAHIYLCEPNETLQARIARTARMNRDIAARLLPFAITDGSTPWVQFYLPADNLSGLGSTVLSSMARDNGYLSPERRVSVPARSIDSLVDQGLIEGIDVMKIDVEHGEDAVVRGAARSLVRFRPRLIMVETSPDSEASRALSDLGYVGYTLDAQGRRHEVPADFWGNLFFASGAS